MMITVQLEAFQEGKSILGLKYLHYQEDLHLYHLEM